MKTIRQASDFPRDSHEHYAILEDHSVHIPGDERSRTHPGHGYPESTEYYTSLRLFSNKEELEKWLGSHPGNHVILAVRRLIAKTSVQVEVGG